MITKSWRLHVPKIWLFIVILGLLIASLIWVNRTVSADLDPTRGSANLASSTMKDCSHTSTGILPLTDMARTVYDGSAVGGLYPDGNDVPSNHLQMGMVASQSIEPLNQQGHPASSGKIVFMSLGMSNTSQEFDRFREIANGHTNEALVLENGAQAGYDAARIADPNSDYWTRIDAHLASRDLSRLQVQAIWLKEAVASDTDQFPQDAQQLQGYLRMIVLIAKNRYPNTKVIYISSRTYGGYGEPHSISPEPWAFEGGFAVKWLIESQVLGEDPALSYNNAPWLGWGPYLWADGMTPRSDGLIWRCNDFEDDGIHPSPSGETKVANILFDFLNSDPTTQWFPGP
ncbi:MAG: hypothetical protein WAM60_23640 [Candidatus Promineifilaceae bacterium]